MPSLLVSAYRQAWIIRGHGCSPGPDAQPLIQIWFTSNSLSYAILVWKTDASSGMAKCGSGHVMDLGKLCAIAG